MSWIGATMISLALLDPPAAQGRASRAGTLVDPERPNVAVVLLSSRRAWSPRLVEGVAVCSTEERCASVATVESCEGPACPFGFGTVYVVGEDIAELDALTLVDEATLVALEQEPSLRSLVAEVRAHRAGPPVEPPPVEPPPVEPPVEPPPVELPPLETPAEDRPLVRAHRSPRMRWDPPEWSGWNGTVGWSVETTITPVAGVFFDGDDDANFAVGGVATLGVHHQFEMRPSRGPNTPKGAKRQSPFFAGWVGNNFGADLVLTAYYADRRPFFGIAADFAARGVYNNFGDGRGTQKPSRMRVFTALDLLVPVPGLLLDAEANPRLDVRFGGPISLLVRQRLGVEIRFDVGFYRYGGPTEGYILLGVGLLMRNRLGRGW